MLDQALTVTDVLESPLDAGDVAAQQAEELCDVLNLSLGPVDLGIPLLGVGVHLDNCADGPVTVMVCSFEETDAAVIRLFGKARVTPLAESPLASLLVAQTIEGWKGPPRQVVEVQIDSTMTSCGYGVPVMKFVRQRRVVDRGRRYKQPAPARTPVEAK